MILLDGHRLTIEQIAGDLIPGAHIASGFQRNTLTNREGGTDPEQFRVEACIDRVSTTAKVFLGITMGCAQCHDHPFALWKQQEYWGMAAFFAQVQTPGRAKQVYQLGVVDDPNLTLASLQEAGTIDEAARSAVTVGGTQAG